MNDEFQKKLLNNAEPVTNQPNLNIFLINLIILYTLIFTLLLVSIFSYLNVITDKNSTGLITLSFLISLAFSGILSSINIRIIEDYINYKIEKKVSDKN